MTATKMKSIQSIITMYFIMRSINNIIYISPKNKLKDFLVPQGSYKDRKKSAILITKELIAKDGPSSLFFESHQKKDDLADSYLQALWFIKNL